MNLRRGLVAISIAGLGVACARDRETELPDRPAQQQPPRTPQRTFPLMSVSPRPPVSASARPASSNPPAALPPAALPPAALAPDSGDTKSDASDLFHAQDACLSSCDQFACMKIASAYRQGAGLPKDVLAGRRYAIHACQECGKPGPGIAEQCPDYQLAPEPSKQK
jgi:hypothetical protein